MDWDFAVRRQREALLGVLAALLAMAGLVGDDARFRSPLSEGVRGGDSGDRPTLPRHLHRAVLRLLRPAESAARRLVIMAARGLVVSLPRPRARKPKPKPPAFRPGTITGIWTPPQLRTQPDPAPPAMRALPLFDPLPRTGFSKRKVTSGIPRICLPGFSAPHPAPPARPSKGRQPLGPDDTIDAARLLLRLQALGRALDDLPAQARRFARWQARWAAGAGEKERQSPGRARRVWPLRPGRLPSAGRRASAGGRAGSTARPDHAVHEILWDTHALALQALEEPDSS